MSERMCVTVAVATWLTDRRAALAEIGKYVDLALEERCAGVFDVTIHGEVTDRKERLPEHERD